jgi:hypothetical protein
MKYLFIISLVMAGYAFMPIAKNETPVKSQPIVTDSSAGPVRGLNKVSFTVGKVINSSVAVEGIAGFSKQGRPIAAFYFPGTSNRRALVIGGVHGSELSAIEVANRLVAKLLRTEDIYYSVIVIPCLFPDNAVKASSNPAHIGSVYNVGRYSHSDATDPNRQMPALGRPYHSDNPFDYAGRPIEPENQLMLQFIQEFHPQRIINLHAIRTVEQAGIYADPRTNNRGMALEYGTDSSLAVDMAVYIETKGGSAPGNKLQKSPSSVYHADPPVKPAGEMQRRNLQGSKLPGKRGYGVSLGSWASTAVADQVNTAYNRPAIRLLTMEFPGYKRPADYKDPEARMNCIKQVELYAAAIREVFLGDKYLE